MCSRSMPLIAAHRLFLWEKNFTPILWGQVSLWEGWSGSWNLKLNLRSNLWSTLIKPWLRLPQVYIKSCSVSNIFCNWLERISKELKLLVLLLEVVGTHWSIWLRRNHLVFERKILFSFVSYIYLGYPPETRYMLSSPWHTGGVLVFVLQITSVCDFLFWWLCAFLVVF